MLLVLESGPQAAFAGRRTTDLRSIFADAAQALANLARSRRVRVEVRLPKKPVPLLLDTNMVRRAADNLISYLIRISSPGDTVGISVEHVSGNVDVTTVRGRTTAKPPDADAADPAGVPELGFCKAVCLAHGGAVRYSVSGAELEVVTELTSDGQSQPGRSRATE